ncbi:MAG: putative Fe-S cluster assembly protein SufT [Verrucomicrobiae bacterium]|nr:putative Fe-S cluster assembly protein SufT [Verrucomicrobiae bacterium]
MQQTDETLKLTRDVRAVAIPDGTYLDLTRDTEVVVTQKLGGNYTVIANGRLARIDARDLDALGLEAAKPLTSASGEFDEKLIWEQMKSCFDPEIPVNVVDLGLIYSCEATLKPDGKRRVEVKMTLTAPGCGMGPVIANDVRDKVSSVPGVDEVDVEVVWEPTWNQGMMTEAAKLQLGLL